MEFITNAHNPLILAILGVLLTVCLSATGMSSQVAMNEGKTATLAVKDAITLSTDQLKGCVVTLLNLEHTDGQRTVTMCHFSHDRKFDNEAYLQELVAQITQENKLETIKKASCIIIPPGVNEFNRIKPILDEKWEQLIVNALGKTIPGIRFQIKPYLFNTKDSAVEYTVAKNSQKITIVNNSSQEDTQNKDLLLQCHNYIQPSLCQKWAPLIVVLSGVAAYLAYQMN